MSYRNSQSVPFESADFNHGLKRAKGLLKLTKKGIELEYQEQDSFLGIIKSEVKTTQVLYKDLESIRFEKGWFRAKIILKTSSLHLLQQLPGGEQGSCTLKVKRKHRKEAQNTVSQARVALSEYKLEQLDNGNNE
jgi:hypothetical protein